VKRLIGYAIVGASIVLGGVWVAAQVSLTTFQPGDVIRAAEVNANFEALRDASYTRAEVEAMIAAAVSAVTPAYAYVLGGGGVAASSNVESTSRSDVGRYCVVVARTFAVRGAQATLTQPGLTTDHISVGTGHGSHCNQFVTNDLDVVPVYITNAAGAYVDRSFAVHVPAR
jgi:hypothetical protein